MATGILIWVSIIVSVFVVSSISLSCDRLCDDLDSSGSGNESNSSYRCIINSTDYVQQCCSSVESRNFTMKFNGLDLGITELVIDSLTFENCAKPIIIEHITTVEITAANFRYCK